MKVQMNVIQNIKIFKQKVQRPTVLPTPKRLVHVESCFVGQRLLGNRGYG